MQKEITGFFCAKTPRLHLMIGSAFLLARIKEKALMKFYFPSVTEEVLGNVECGERQKKEKELGRRRRE